MMFCCGSCLSCRPGLHNAVHSSTVLLSEKLFSDHKLDRFHSPSQGGTMIPVLPNTNTRRRGGGDIASTGRDWRIIFVRIIMRRQIAYSKNVSWQICGGALSAGLCSKSFSCFAIWVIPSRNIGRRVDVSIRCGHSIRVNLLSILVLVQPIIHCV